MKPVQPLKWHGGKYYLASWILSNFPDRSRYTHYNEPFAGGLSVLFRHDPEGKAETVNDLNSELSNFWHVLAYTPDQMLRALWGTPLSESAWIEATQVGALDPDRVRRATSFFIRYRQSRQGLRKDYCTPTTRTRRGMNENVSSWLSAVDGLQEAHERLRRVEVRDMPAIEFIAKYDHGMAMFYLDPPYMHETRVTTQDYECEMSREDHERLLHALGGVRGMFCLSGYRSDLYDEYAGLYGWRRVEKEIDNKASSKAQKETKVECLWMNY